MRVGQITIALLASWFCLSPNCQAEFTMEMSSDAKQSQCDQPSEGACSEIPSRTGYTEPNVQAPSLPEPNRNVDSYMSIDGSPDVVRGDDGRLRSGAQAAVELNNEAVRRMNEGRHDEAKPMFEKARELMGDAPEGPVFEETQLGKYNRNVINQNSDTVFKYDGNRYNKSGDQ
ncbi:MAG: hypothetical protein K2X29_07810, partial [Candidatus Obscuribacterales bacterium]|nr:hypothetical protein [Candidatus Obscuribacterales bacterium]